MGTSWGNAAWNWVPDTWLLLAIIIVYYIYGRILDIMLSFYRGIEGGTNDILMKAAAIVGAEDGLGGFVSYK